MAERNTIAPDGSMNDKEWYNTCWNYFVLMSNQRMQMINFYISIEIVLIGALFALMNFTVNIRWAEYVVATAIPFFSLMFYGLDFRTKKMIHICEEMMQSVEETYQGSKKQTCLPIHNMNKKSDQTICLSYSKLFFIQFIVIGLFGVSCIVMLITGKI